VTCPPTARARNGGSGKALQTGLTYTAMLTPGENCRICAQLAEVPGAISQGRTEAEEGQRDQALELALEWRRDEGEPLPSAAR
jgi:predicted RNase H-like HicB family nuclease